jgi:hypothetical protein
MVLHISEIKFPELDKFYNKFCSAIYNSGMEQNFMTKWGLKSLADVYDILSNNIQGGYASHKHSILSIPPSGSILTIGPGIGFCVFLLSELYDSVFVIEPDSENCQLINSISKHYRTDKDKLVGDFVQVFHAGISITDEAIEYWNAKRSRMTKSKVGGSILNFVIQGASELKEVFHEEVSSIYLHKVLSSLSISCRFEDIIFEIAPLLEENGAITWAEPDYIFNDILQVDGLDPTGRLKSLFNNWGLDFNVMNYKVSSKVRGNDFVETWTLLKVRRSLDNEG